MSDFIDQVQKLSNAQKLELLNTQFSATELIEILEKLIALDPKIQLELDLYDCCGTGGDQANTFNISTTTAIIAAANGLMTCKNGGRSSSSKTGSVDVLEELGVNFGLDLETKIQGLKQFGLAFHSSRAIAERMAPLKNLARENKLSSFLSLLGPFTNPFYLKAQIIGVGKKEWLGNMKTLAKHVIKKTYCQSIALVQSINAQGQVFDELCSTEKAQVFVFKSDNTEFCFDFDPKDFELSDAQSFELQGGASHKENAAILESVIANDSKLAMKETCLINFALLKALSYKDLNEKNIREQILLAYQRGFEKLEDGSCKQNLERFLELQSSK